MSITLALDIYGTLINPLAVRTALAAHVGDDAPAFAELWRTKQLEYSFRRGLVGAYRDFANVTRAALEFTCAAFAIELSATDSAALMDQYRALDPFPDAAPALRGLSETGVALHAFSNGVADDIAALLRHAGLDKMIASIVSADEVQTFKPDPRLYRHFLARTGSSPHTTWLVSSNPFDVIGAAACGWHTAWVQRQASSVFDPWDHAPTVVVSSLEELLSVPAIAQHAAGSRN